MSFGLELVPGTTEEARVQTEGIEYREEREREGNKDYCYRCVKE